MLPQSADKQEDQIFKARILIVEDDLNLLEGIQTVLELDNYSVISVENGKQALAVLRESTVPPDLIVSDIMMPQMDGIQLLREVRKVPAWIKIPVHLPDGAQRKKRHSARQAVGRGRLSGQAVRRRRSADRRRIAPEPPQNAQRTVRRRHVDREAQYPDDPQSRIPHAADLRRRLRRYAQRPDAAA